MTRTKSLILISSKGAHDYKGNAAIMADFLFATGKIEPTITEELSALESPSIEKYDLCIFYTEFGNLTDAQKLGLMNFVASGKGFIGIHSASVSFMENPEYLAMLGGKFTGHSPYHEFTVSIKDKEHPITQGLSDFKIRDELYYHDYDPRVHTLCVALWEGIAWPMAWTKQWGKGKVFFLALGHDAAAFSDSNFQKLVIRGVDWVTSEEKG